MRGFLKGVVLSQSRGFARPCPVDASRKRRSKNMFLSREKSGRTFRTSPNFHFGFGSSQFVGRCEKQKPCAAIIVFSYFASSMYVCICLVFHLKGDPNSLTKLFDVHLFKPFRSQMGGGSLWARDSACKPWQWPR